MSDPAIKLFGKTIQLLHLDKQQQQQQQCCDKEFKGTLEKEHAPTQTEDTRSHPSIDESINQPISSGSRINDDDPKTPTTEKETSSKSTTKKDNPIDNANSEERAPKPDKIIPCPRCNSMDTKFCYYNNYNVNQPRHFCKNCQRYWTAGGTMRNTPVGSGRRKNKSSSSASYYRHLIVSEALHPSLKNNGSVLNFGSHVPLCESMNSALNFSDSQKSEDDRSSSASNLVEKRETNGLNNFQGYPIQIPCFPHPAPPWPYLGPPGIPANFYPAPQYWGCTVQVPPSPWSTQYIAPISPLGKHSRDGNLLPPSSSSRNEVSSKDKNSESSILVPKTLRINNPNEAAKNSLWSTLGISKEGHGNNTSSVNGGNLCKAFQSKSDEKGEVDVTSLVNLQANPAALSRSHNFRETS